MITLLFSSCKETNSLPPIKSQVFENLLRSPSPQQPTCSVKLKEITQWIHSEKQKFQGDSIFEFVALNGEKWTLGCSRAVDTTQTDPLPLILYLHGGNGRPEPDRGTREWKMLSFLLKTHQNILIASPSANRSAPWWSPEGMDRIRTSVRYLATLYPIDPNNVTLAGVSDGGTAQFLVASESNHPFTSFVPIASFGPLLYSFGLQISPEQMAKSGVAMHLFISGRDRLYPSEDSERFARYLQDAGVNLDFRVVKDAEHGFDYKESTLPFWDSLLLSKSNEVALLNSNKLAQSLMHCKFTPAQFHQIR